MVAATGGEEEKRYSGMIRVYCQESSHAIRGLATG